MKLEHQALFGENLN